jgi:hypothetical protein
MIYDFSTGSQARLDADARTLRTMALRSAIVLRDCSFRTQSSATERRACRTLMRGQALAWRHPAARAA